MATKNLFYFCFFIFFLKRLSRVLKFSLCIGFRKGRIKGNLLWAILPYIFARDYCTTWTCDLLITLQQLYRLLWNSFFPLLLFKKAVQCTKIFAMCRIQEGPNHKGSIVPNFTLYFCKSLLHDLNMWPSYHITTTLSVTLKFCFPFLFLKKTI